MITNKVEKYGICSGYFFGYGSGGLNGDGVSYTNGIGNVYGLSDGNCKCCGEVFSSDDCFGEDDGYGNGSSKGFGENDFSGEGKGNQE